MSKVISFRLNPDNPREDKALTVLQRWGNKGFSYRHTIAEALLKLESENDEVVEKQSLMNLSQQIQELLEVIEIGSTLVTPKIEDSSRNQLSDGFITSIIKSAKTGLKPM